MKTLNLELYCGEVFAGEWEPAMFNRRRAAITRYRALINMWFLEHPTAPGAGTPWPKSLWRQALAEVGF